MQQNIRDFIALKNLAIVGVSRSGKKFGNAIATEMRQRGYNMFIVHPEAREIDGQPCYPDLASLQSKVEGVVICVPPRRAAQVLQEAADAGIRHIWLQQGAQSPDVLAKAKQAGLDPVPGKCLLMYAEPVRSIHGFHRAIARLFGQL